MNKIDDAIKRSGISFVELAQRMGITKQNLYSIRQNPSYNSLEKIATALDIPIWQLFASPEEMEKEYGGGGAPGACGAKCPHCGGALNIKVE